MINLFINRVFRAIKIDIDLGLGKKTHQVNTSDFSEDYVLINSEYRS